MIASTQVEPAYLSVPAYAKTLGPEVAGIAELAGFAPDPEQRLALDAIFGMGRDNKVAAFEAAVIASRQNIKTGLFKQCALGWLFVTDQRLIIWSAHEFSTAQEAHRDLAELIEGCDPLRRRVKAITNGNGDEGIELLTGQRVKFKARTKTGGRGLTGDKVVFDEAFALQQSHMGSVMPTLSARPDPQVLYGSSAGLASSAVLREVRSRGRAGGDPSLAYIEWCDDLPGDCERGATCDHAITTPGCRLDEEARWFRANTQLGRRISLQYVRAERRALPPSEFARERLGWWDEPEVHDAGVFGDHWDGLIDTTDDRSTSLAYGVAVSPTRDWAAISVAWRRPDGILRLAVGAYGRNTDWVSAKLSDMRAARPGPVVLSTSAKGLVAGATEPSQSLQALAHTALDDAVRGGIVRHSDEAALTTAVRGARWKPYGDTRMFDRKGSVDISPLDAAALAVQGLATSGPSVYEDRGFRTL